jgi:hypothetical protein
MRTRKNDEQSPNFSILLSYNLEYSHQFSPTPLQFERIKVELI